MSAFRAVRHRHRGGEGVRVAVNRVLVGNAEWLHIVLWLDSEVEFLERDLNDRECALLARHQLVEGPL